MLLLVPHSDQALTTAGGTGTRTPTISQPAQLEGVLLALRPAPDTYYYGHDQQDSTRMLTGPDATVYATYSYDPYGRTTSHTGPVTTALLYDGQYRDAESGLYYLRARYYDPQNAQFLTRDPLSAVTDAPYGYAAAAPLDLADPYGLDAGEFGPPKAPVGYVPTAMLVSELMHCQISADEYERQLSVSQHFEELVLAWQQDNIELNAEDKAAASMWNVVPAVIEKVGIAAGGCAMTGVSAIAALGPSLIVPVAGEFVEVGSGLVGCALGAATSQIDGPQPDYFPDTTPAYIPRHASPAHAR